MRQVELRHQPARSSPRRGTSRGRELARKTQHRLGFGMTASAVDGALTVFVYLELVLPPTARQVSSNKDLAQWVNLGVFIAYLAISVVVGTLWSQRRLTPMYDWLKSGAPAGEAERRAVVRVAREQAILGLVLWESAAFVFFVVNLAFSTKVAGDIAATIGLAGLSMAALAYLIAERIMRPVVGLAFEDGVPDRPSGIGVLPRILLTWAFCTGVPVLGIALAYIGQPRRVLSDLVVPTYFLVGVAIVIGLAGMVIAAKSVSEPLAEVRAAMDRVGAGDTAVDVRVDDASEIGLLQAGFNRMVDGLRERELIADLFGRHVGVEVAREALERGVRLGGETREAAILFVDIVGSTALAAERPAEEIVERLNAFFGVVVDVVSTYGGWVNKFEGDAAMCVFGVPVSVGDASGAALAAARTLRDRLLDLSGLDVGIGVAAGTVVAGNVGAEARYEYTVIGDPVNEAARLTEIAKTRPERLVASGAALGEAAPAERRCWQLDGEIVLRGRARATQLAVPRV